jgi:hypothetical protein
LAEAAAADPLTPEADRILWRGLADQMGDARRAVATVDLTPDHLRAARQYAAARKTPDAVRFQRAIERLIG